MKWMDGLPVVDLQSGEQPIADQSTFEHELK